MPCRVGITTHLSDRKAYWERKVVGMKNWTQQFVGSKSAAQDAENSRQNFCNNYQDRGNCHAHHGGGDPEILDWYLYEFDYIRER